MENRIRELRKKRGMTMKQLGKELGLAESTISQYETGKRNADNETLLKMGDLFGVSVGYILGNSDDVMPPDLYATIGQKIIFAAGGDKDNAVRALAKIGISAETASEMIRGSYPFTMMTLQQIADHFGRSTQFFLSSQEKSPALTEKDERDIAKRLANVLADLENSQDGLMFSGEALDDTTRELLIASLHNSMQIGKTLAKQKFTPKKYREED